MTSHQPMAPGPLAQDSSRDRQQLPRAPPGAAPAAIASVASFSHRRSRVRRLTADMTFDSKMTSAQLAPKRGMTAANASLPSSCRERTHSYWASQQYCSWKGPKRTIRARIACDTRRGTHGPCAQRRHPAGSRLRVRAKSRGVVNVAHHLAVRPVAHMLSEGVVASVIRHAILPT